jgi:undecaprenyl-diphosphatase
VLAVALWFLGRWLWKRREPLLSPANNLADRVLEWQVVRGFRRRFASQIEWFFRRFSPRSAYGLTLTAGLVLAALFAWLFAVVFEGVLVRAPITQFDRMVAVALNERAYPLFTQVMKVVTFFGGGVWVATVCVVGVAILAWRKMWRDALLLLTSVAGAALLMTVLKVLVQRPRPDFIEPLVHAGGYSFPSGHATTSAALYLTLGLLAAGWVKRWETRIYILLGTLAVIALIGFSRLYLGVHYVSDVLAGFALGAFWVTLCVTAGTVFVRAQRGLSTPPALAVAQGAHTPANHGHDGPDACVFSTARAAILDDDTRLEELSLESLEQLLDLHGDEDVADLGSGTGFYAERLASRTTGVVYAVEFQQAMQDLHRAKGPAANVRLVLADLDELPLGPLSLDRALSVSAFHEAHGARGLERLAAALRPGGRFVVVDWRHDPEAADIGPGLHHRMTREQIDETLAPWFRVVASEDVGRHFLAVVAVPARS